VFITELGLGFVLSSAGTTVRPRAGARTSVSVRFRDRFYLRVK
jgi:hypothetical protein